MNKLVFAIWLVFGVVVLIAARQDLTVEFLNWDASGYFTVVGWITVVASALGLLLAPRQSDSEHHTCQ